MHEDLTIWQSVAADLELLDAARDLDPRDVRSTATLRKRWPAEHVRVALDLCNARRKAVQKGWPNAPTMVADVLGVEQATSFVVGQHKVRRLADSVGEGTPVFDLCCGIGGDTMVLARHFERTVAIDRSPTRAWMAAQNSDCEVAVCDVTDWSPPDGDARTLIHIDPARRHEASGARRREFADYEPGPRTIARLLASPRSDVVVKLGPGIDPDDLTAHAADYELEFVSDRRELVQAILWSKRLSRAPGVRTATALRVEPGASLAPAATLTVSGTPNRPPLHAYELRPGDLLHVPDPALERAELLGMVAAVHGLGELHSGLGLLVGPLESADDWLMSYRVRAVLPWRESKLRAWLQGNDAGIVTVKTRGKAVDASSAQRDLRGAGSTPFVVFGLRLGTQRIGVITSPPEAPRDVANG